MGLPPAAAPGGHLDAFVWIKPAGESDGSSRLIKNNQGKGFDKMCDPNFITADGVLTGALPNAPIAGEWFHDQFVMLINNAYPAIGGLLRSRLLVPRRLLLQAAIFLFVSSRTTSGTQVPASASR